MRRFAIGDIHGSYRGMIQVLERAGFNKEEDLLIGIGDYVDGWSQSSSVITFLMELPNFLGVIGNHDYWASNWLKGGNAEYIWVSQGGAATIKSYEDIGRATQQKHGAFLQAMPYYLEIDDMAFIHGGCFDTENLKDLMNISGHELMWDRDLYYTVAYDKRQHEDISLFPYKKVFVGHTQTSRELPDFTPFQYKNFWNIDQGAGWNGKLTLVDIDTDEWWQSDFSQDLYPEEPGRR